MKKITTILSLLFATSFVVLYGQHNNSELPSSINEVGTAPDPSAMFDIQSTSKGVLIPRMTTAQRTAIASPANGLLVYDIETNGFWFYNGSTWSDLSVEDSPWEDSTTLNSPGIYYDTGNISVNTFFVDSNSVFYAFRPSDSFGPDKANIYAYRSGFPNVAANGGTNFSQEGIDSAIKGYSNWGNSYSAAIAGYSYLDYENSAAVLGSRQAGNIYGALGFRDSTQIWAGYFNGDIRFRPESSYTPELYLDIVREYQDEGEFGEFHQLYVIPNALNIEDPDYDFYYLGNNTNHFDGIFVNSITSENNLLVDGTTILTGSNELSVGAGDPLMKFHLKQDIANRGIRTEHHTSSDYWDTGIGLTSKNYKFYYNNVSKADIASTDGAYVQFSDYELKSDITYLNNVLTKVLQLRPSTYRYVDADYTGDLKTHGFIAQEVAEVFPEIIRKKEDGKMALAYDDFGVLAIQAIKEQQEIIENQQTQIDELRSMILDMKK